MAAALIVLGSIEAALHLVDPLTLVPYERGQYSALSSKILVQAFGPPDIVVVGSSRAQISILSPVLKEEMEKRTGAETSVGNYGVGGARLMEIEPKIKFLLRQEKKPKLILYGISIEQVSFPELYNERSAIYWGLADWWSARSRYGGEIDRLLPHALRSTLADRSLTLRYRKRPTVWIHDLNRGYRLDIPLIGGLVAEHLDPENQDAVLEVTEELQKDVSMHIKSDHLVDGTYPLNRAKVALLEELIRECAANRVKLILFEVPNAEVFTRYLPHGTVQGFNDLMRRVATRNGTEFLSLLDLGLNFANGDFRDPVHLNTSGATRLTRALAAHLVPK